MSEHLSDENILAYRGRVLAAADLLSASNHLAACAACRVRVSPPKELHDGLEAIRAVLDAEASTSHLTYDEIAGYVDGQLRTEDRARMELHARECSPCAADLEGIQTLRNALRSELEMPQAKERPWGRLADLWQRRPNWKGSLVLAGAAACALLLVLVVRGPGPQHPNPRARADSPNAGQTATADSIRDGKLLVSIAAGGMVSGLDGLPGPDQAAIKRMLAEKRVDAPASIAGLAAGRGVLLGSQAQAPRALLLGPVGRVIETDRPVLRWKPVPGARFLVSVFDSRYDERASSGWIQNAEWTVPRALGRGVVYSWQLNVRQNGGEFTVPAPPAPEARFRILSTAEEADLIRVRGTSGDSHLVLGLQYARAGLLDEAGQELRALRDRNPGSETVAALLASVERLIAARPQSQ